VSCLAAGSSSSSKERDRASTMAASKKSDSQTEPEPTSTANPQSQPWSDQLSPSSEEALVLSYLRKHGLTEAASSLTKLLSERSAVNQETEAGVSKKAKTATSSPLDYNLSDSDERPTTGSGYDLDGAPSIALWGAGCPKLKTGGERDEARGYVEGFTSLITWILSLGDDPAFVIPGVNDEDEIDDTDEQKEEEQDDVDAMEVDEESQKPNKGLAKLVQHALASASNNISNPPSLSAKQRSQIPPTNNLLTPPSTKPELLSLSFPLMVHTYCELQSCSMSNTARAFLQTYRHLYEPSHPDAISDLDKCKTTSLLVELNEAVMNSNSIQNELRAIQTQLANGSKKREELQKSLESYLEKERDKNEKSSIILNQENNLAKIDGTLSRLSSRLQELTSRNNQLQSRLSAFPFLRRVRALKWNVTISAATYHALEGYAAANSESMVMMALLMNRCHLIVERRDPLPFVPSAVLDDLVDGDKKETVRWAAPVHPAVRAMETGGQQLKSILVPSEALPYPKYHLDGEKDAESKSAVEFNRALLVNGFRRLEALELKSGYESYGATNSAERSNIADPLAPSVLLGSLCCSNEADVGAGAPWAESHVGITSASVCPPDGRKVAVGCDDAAVRIWSLDRPVKDTSKDGSSHGSALGEPSMVLLGHKNGFPVFDVDWTRNGRTLLSAGGDGSIRLWDTEAVGPYGKLSNVSMQKKASGATSASLSGAVDVPGSKAESMVEINGAALSVYRGHAPSTPVWSVSSAPSGYYFASAGSDYTARIWCTDRCSPLRVLSGHISPSVNCVTWHPNCNYVLTASDDKTCRMWDIQTGNCVRILSGSSRGLNLVRVSPSGKYAAAAGYDNIVRIWDLGNGRLVNELRPSEAQERSFSDGVINSMCYSSCGSALAVSGEDFTVKIWDVRGVANNLADPDYFAANKGHRAVSYGSNPSDSKQLPGMMSPAASFRTNNISVLDLKYTKRNLLLAVGNYAA
jgi:WD40 repeat protein